VPYLTYTGCHEQLYRVDHSPFYDCYFLYCDHCPMLADISFYDPSWHRSPLAGTSR
jgi:hypothetical protein